MKNIAQLCLDDIIAKLKTIPEVQNKAWSLVDEDDLFSKSIAMKFPSVGVVYEGIRSRESAEKAGKTSEITFAIYFLYQTGSIGKVDYKPIAIQLLDSVRGLLIDKASPTGHKWKFGFESPAEDMHKALVYYQRWSAVVIL